MCNANNHPFNCTCGWGGENHKGGIGGNANNYFKNNEYKSYVNPNAKCPVCGAWVYFYKCENGGRVFFDDLGPPWPKHLCTDINYSEVDIVQQLSVGKREWLSEGWTPALIEQNIKKSSFSYYISRLDNRISNRFEIISYDSEFENCVKEDVLNQVRKIDDATVQINSFSISMDRQAIFEIKSEPTEIKKFFELNNFNRLLFLF